MCLAIHSTGSEQDVGINRSGRDPGGACCAEGGRERECVERSLRHRHGQHLDMREVRREQNAAIR